MSLRSVASNARGGDELGDAGLRVERVVEVGAGEAGAAGVTLRVLDAVVRDRAAVLARLAAAMGRGVIPTPLTILSGA